MKDQRIERNFGLVDDKGFSVGALVYLVEKNADGKEIRESRTFETCDYSKVIGREKGQKVYATYMFTTEDTSNDTAVSFEAQPQALRNSNPFGALQRTHKFDTDAERTEWIEGYFARAEKRLAKKFEAATVPWEVDYHGRVIREEA